LVEQPTPTRQSFEVLRFIDQAHGDASPV